MERSQTWMPGCGAEGPPLPPPPLPPPPLNALAPHSAAGAEHDDGVSSSRSGCRSAAQRPAAAGAPSESELEAARALNAGSRELRILCNVNCLPGLR